MASLSQPRCIKRVCAFYNAGYDVEVYGNTRGKYDINVYPSGINVHNWGIVKSGSNYLNKFNRNYINIKDVIENNSTDIIYYSFAFDISLILFLLKKKYIYEISDLVYGYFNKGLRFIFKTVDKLLISHSLFTVVTSEGFYRYLYPKGKTKVLIHPNRVSQSLGKVKRKLSNFDDNSLRFAYVGAFRYPNTVFRFAEIIGKYYPQHKFYFYGNSELTPLVLELEKKYSNIRYFGKFQSPQDLESIYDNIDIVVACYDTTTLNERVAEPNKLYEAICFCKPIIVSSNTFLSKKVNQMKVGFAIDASKNENIITFLENLQRNELQKISIIEYNLSSSDYIDNPKDIIEVMKRI